MGMERMNSQIISLGVARRRFKGKYSQMCAIGALFCLFGAEGIFAQKVPVRETTLANGMRLLMVDRHDEPSVAGGWVAHIGSSNERPGVTGVAHLFEHMMFKGTPTIGTKDYQKDLQIMQEQERLRDEIRREERKMRAMYRRGGNGSSRQPGNKTSGSKGPATQAKRPNRVH